MRSFALSTLSVLCLAAGFGGSAVAATQSYQAVLSGANEVGAGDPDGFGLALLTIDDATNTVNYEISFGNLGTVAAGHIHQGAAGANGPVIIPFGVPAGTAGSGTLSGSVVDPDAALITSITAGGFYVNLHTDGFGAGAIRGQLAPVPEPETYALLVAGLGAVMAWSRRRPRQP